MISRMSYLSRPSLWFSWLIIVGAFGGVLLMLFMGQFQFLSVLVIGSTVLIFMVKQPMAGLIGLLLVDTQFFSFIKVDTLPYLQVAPSLRINSQDILTAVLFARAFFVLARRRERPMFLIPLLLFFCVVVLSFILGLLSGTSDLILGGRIFRLVARYAIYFIIVATVYSRQRFKIFIKMLYGIAVVGLILHFIETVQGQYFVLNPDWDTFFEGGIPYYIAVGYSEIPYIWNRVPFYLYITYFLSLACLLCEKQWNRWHLVFATIASLSFILMLIRSSSIFIVAGIVALLFLSGRGRRLIKFVFIVGFLVVGIALISAFYTQVSFDETFVVKWVVRLQTLLNFQQESSFVGRADLWREQLTCFEQAPLLVMALAQPRCSHSTQIRG